MSLEESIIFAKDPDDKIIIINKNELINYNRLDNAVVFKLLFKLEDDNRFGDFPMESTDGYINIFKKFNIYSKEWFLLISFLKNGFVPYDQQKNEFFIHNLEIVNNLCNKLGGIESFDNYYKEFYRTKLQDDNEYNPQSPEEDIKDKYLWTLIDNDHQGDINNFTNILSNTIVKRWSAHKTFSNLDYFYVWYRLKKD